MRSPVAYDQIVFIEVQAAIDHEFVRTLERVRIRPNHRAHQLRNLVSNQLDDTGKRELLGSVDFQLTAGQSGWKRSAKLYPELHDA